MGDDTQRPKTEAEIEREEREKLGMYDSEANRKECLSFKTMTPDEIRQAELENEYRLLELQKKFDCFALDVMNKLTDSKDPKSQYGRNAMSGSLGTIARYIYNKEVLKLERDKLEWAKEVTKQARMDDFANEISQGIIVDINVQKAGEGDSDTTKPNKEEAS